MPKMKFSILKTLGVVCISSLGIISCGPKDTPPTVYFPDMYYPVAYDPLSQANDAYTDHENDLPPFVSRDGGTAMSPVEGTIPQNKEGLVELDITPKNQDAYNAGYAEALKIVASPLNPANREKDLERGKKMYERTCSACHGLAGDGQGPIVASGAYSGVPAYKDRAITVGSVHYVLMYGRNAMGSYAGQLMPADRWRVAMYVMDAFKKEATPAAPATTANAAPATPAATTTAKPTTNATAPAAK